MDTCDVLIIGGGPAGSTCAWRLVQAGIDVVVVDQALFPRHKACAGWVVPSVFDALQMPAGDYGAGHSLEPITGFRTGVVGRRPTETRYGCTVSYAIRRSEFDDHLLRRSGARVRPGLRVDRLRPNGGGWIVNDAISARIVVGAGGHFCPVARRLNPSPRSETVVAARVVEFQMDAAQQAACRVSGSTPEIYFERDLSGYGWMVRKGNVLNVGFGRIGARGLAARIAAFTSHLRDLGRLPAGIPTDWPGHAYLVRETTRRTIVGDSMLLAGDAAGLARGCSGEGIGPAVESGLAAAETIIAARGAYGAAALDSYRSRLDARLGPAPSGASLAGLLPAGVRSWVARSLLGSAGLTRRFVLDRWLQA